MALWDKLRTELDRAGRTMQGAFDEGKLRLEIFRVRQLADKSAAALGYAVYRARQQGQEVEAETYARLSSTLAAHEAEATRLEAQMAEASRRGGADVGTQPASGDRPADVATSRPTSAADSAAEGARADASAEPRPPESPRDGPII
jgi:hypothetical protein